MADTRNRGSRTHRMAREASRTLERLLARFRLRHVTRLGSGAWVRGAPYIENPGRIEIGYDLRLHSYPTPSHIVTGPGGVVTIGNGVTIGPGAAIASETEIRIGDQVVLGPSVMILDTDFHDVRDRDGSSTPAPVVIEAGARLGPGVVVLKGAHIGYGATVEAGGVVQGGLRAGARAWGVPARVRRPGPRGDSGAHDGDPVARVASVVAETFGLAPPVPEHLGRADIPGWDSLGALRLLLALEEEFGVPLPEDALREAHSVADLAQAVETHLD